MYFIVAADFMPSILKGFGMDDTTADENETRMIFIIAACVLLFPIGL